METNPQNNVTEKSDYELRKERYEKRNAGKQMPKADDAIAQADVITMKGSANLDTVNKLLSKGVSRYSEAKLTEVRIGQESLARFNTDPINKEKMQAILHIDFDTNPESFRQAVIKLSKSVGAPTRIGVITPKLIDAMYLNIEKFDPDQQFAINDLIEHKNHLIQARKDTQNKDKKSS